MNGLIAWESTPSFKIAKHKAPILGEVTVSCSLLACFVYGGVCFSLCSVVEIRL